MMLQHRFVTNIPPRLDDATLYISLEHRTMLHNCACGCGNEVATPLGPDDWSLTFDGETVSIDPSIGNWSFPCKSHYWVSESRIVWADRWSPHAIDRWRSRECRMRESYYSTRSTDRENQGGD